MITEDIRLVPMNRRGDAEIVFKLEDICAAIATVRLRDGRAFHIDLSFLFEKESANARS